MLGIAVLSIPLLAHAGVLSFVANIISPHAEAAVVSDISPLSNPAPQIEDGALLADNSIGGISENQSDTPISDKISVYTVESGDTLSSIAAQFNVSVNTIRWNNDISGSSIRIGQKLTILPVSGVRHTVKSGDTLSSIAKLYKAKESDIESYNNITNADVLNVGDVVIVPNGEMSANSDSSSAPSSSSNNVPPSPRSATNSLARVRIGGPQITLPDDYFITPVKGIKTQGIHGYNAVDIGAPKGTPIHAAAAGKVIVSLTGGWNGGYGTYVVIEHPNGVETLYAHMSKNVAVENSEVAQGDIIGYVGATGEATGPHLHVEVRGAKNPF